MVPHNCFLGIIICSYIPRNNGERYLTERVDEANGTDFWYVFQNLGLATPSLSGVLEDPGFLDATENKFSVWLFPFQWDLYSVTSASFS